MRRYCIYFLIISLIGVYGTPVLRAQVEDETLLSMTGASTDFIAVTAETPYQTTIAVYGENLDYLFGADVSSTLGPLTATSVAGNSTGVNLTFTIDAAALTDVQTAYPIVISAAGVPVLTTDFTITLYNPYQADYTAQQPRQFLNNTKHPHRRTKRTLGLNVQWALGGGSATDALYTKRLDDSDTLWAREHFSYKLLLGDDAAAWLKRYDQTMLRYQALGVHVVGMLAYGDASNEFAAPARANWKRFVRLMAKRYGNYVDAWEIWNEPDSQTYLQPNTWKNYRPLLQTGSAMVREYDPDAIVLNGAIATINDHHFMKDLYQHGRRYFDELNVHVYYCDEYRDDGGQLTRLEEDWSALLKLIKPYRPKEHIWVTELGCSTGLDGVDDAMVKRYISAATKFLVAQPRLRPIFLYTLRDRTYLAPYEAYFGLLHNDLSPKPIWRWYKLLSSLKM